MLAPVGCGMVRPVVRSASSCELDLISAYHVWRCNMLVYLFQEHDVHHAEREVVNSVLVRHGAFESRSKREKTNVEPIDVSCKLQFEPLAGAVELTVERRSSKCQAQVVEAVVGRKLGTLATVETDSEDVRKQMNEHVACPKTGGVSLSSPPVTMYSSLQLAYHFFIYH